MTVSSDLMFTPARQFAQRAAGLLKSIPIRGMVTAADVENKLRDKLQASDVVYFSSNNAMERTSHVSC